MNIHEAFSESHSTNRWWDFVPFACPSTLVWLGLYSAGVRVALPRTAVVRSYWATDGHMFKLCFKFVGSFNRSLAQSRKSSDWSEAMWSRRPSNISIVISQGKEQKCEVFVGRKNLQYADEESMWKKDIWCVCSALAYLIVIGWSWLSRELCGWAGYHPQPQWHLISGWCEFKPSSW